MATVDVVHHVAGGAGEAGQADQGVGEREAGAGVAAAGERRSDQGDQELFILSQKKVSSAIKVLENENLALAALLGNLKEQLSQV